MRHELVNILSKCCCYIAVTVVGLPKVSYTEINKGISIRLDAEKRLPWITNSCLMIQCNLCICDVNKVWVAGFLRNTKWKILSASFCLLFLFIQCWLLNGYIDSPINTNILTNINLTEGVVKIQKRSTLIYTKKKFFTI